MSLPATTSERPIFIVGAPRSGTTLLRYMLCTHPRLYIPPESNFIVRFLRQQHDLPLTRAQAIQLTGAILGYKVFFRDWQAERPVPETFVDALPDRRPATLLDALYGQYARQHGAQRWGDKSPIYTGYVAEIARLFPAAQFLHIVRDGRDVALSMLKAYRGARYFYIDLCYAARSWRRRVQTARAAGVALGADRYHELRYERLTGAPEPTLQAVCSFLGETYFPDMIEPHQVAGRHHHSTGIHAGTSQPVTTRSAGRWRTEMAPADKRLFQALAGDLLAELGYETLKLGRLSLSEQARLAGLEMKYAVAESARRLLQTAGVAHPARLAMMLVRGRR